MKVKPLNKCNSLRSTQLTSIEEKKQQERATRISEGISSLLQSHRSGFLVQHPDEQKNIGAWRRTDTQTENITKTKTDTTIDTKATQPIEYQWDWISTYSGVAVRFDQ